MSDIDIVLLPDSELLIVNFWLEQAELADLERRIYTELPTEKDFPAARVHQFNDQQISEPALWLMRYSLQVDVWGGTKNATRSLAETMRSLLVARIVGAHTEGVVTRVATGGLDTTSDDSVPSRSGKARPRCRFDVVLYAHPARVPAGS